MGGAPRGAPATAAVVSAPESVRDLGHDVGLSLDDFFVTRVGLDAQGAAAAARAACALGKVGDLADLVTRRLMQRMAHLELGVDFDDEAVERRICAALDALVIGAPPATAVVGAASAEPPALPTAAAHGAAAPGVAERATSPDTGSAPPAPPTAVAPAAMATRVAAPAPSRPQWPHVDGVPLDRRVEVVLKRKPELTSKEMYDLLFFEAGPEFDFSLNSVKKSVKRVKKSRNDDPSLEQGDHTDVHLRHHTEGPSTTLGAISAASRCDVVLRASSAADLLDDVTTHHDQLVRSEAVCATECDSPRMDALPAQGSPLTTLGASQPLATSQGLELPASVDALAPGQTMEESDDDVDDGEVSDPYDSYDDPANGDDALCFDEFDGADDFY